MSVCEIISSCQCKTQQGHQKKLTKFTAKALIDTTKANIAAAGRLISDHNFQYVLPVIFSQSPLEKFFGKTRQRSGGNFYIDVTDVLASAKVVNFHQLIKFDHVPEEEEEGGCEYCEIDPIERDLENLSDISIEDTQTL